MKKIFSKAGILQKKWSVFFFFLFVLISCTNQKDNQSAEEGGFIAFTRGENDFVLVEDGIVAPIVADGNDYPGLLRILNCFKEDVKRVTSVEPEIILDKLPKAKEIILVGTLGKSKWIDILVSKNKIDTSDLTGKWETSLIQVVDKPFDGIDKALVIVGSDKRGTIFGMFDLSAQIGVSPWNWWADVPVEPRSEIYVKPGRYNLGEPKVKYRGIFINDEEPALGNWARQTFGGFNAGFYQKVYELILRMKGNFLWPAMWGKAHADDDINNANLADEYGIVISYTHHEPMMRAHVEWERYGKGPWNYEDNHQILNEFWRKGIQRMNDYASFVTVGMRGDGDEPMSADSNIKLLTQIVDSQRVIIEQVTQKPAKYTPQLWALYKEVQDYYDMGMRVPDDIMLLYCDDNWGNIRRVPGEMERGRSGGSGMYYHFDYVGGPRNYKWINTNPLPRIWEQMKLSYAHGIDQLWVVNVGDLKPMELPIQFFLDLAWDPDRFDAKTMSSYTRLWAKQQFGEAYSDEIASFLDHYTKINSRRKPELIDWKTFSLANYNEFERVANEYNALAAQAAKVNRLLDKKYADAYYQLVLYPIEACANLYNLYHATAKNHLYASQGRVFTNQLADSVRYYFDLDSLMINKFHTDIANGKWNHMMSQTRIGYTYWQQPPVNVIPPTRRTTPLDGAHPELQIQGQENVFSEGQLPVFDIFNKQVFYLELFNKGNKPFKYTAIPQEKWIHITSAKGSIHYQQRLLVSIDWNIAPKGNLSGLIKVKAGKRLFKVPVMIWNPSMEEQKSINGFIESNGYVSIEAVDYSKLGKSERINWMEIPGIGRTGGGIMPDTYLFEDQQPGEGPFIEYLVYLSNPGEINVYVYFSPTLNYTGGEGLKYAMSIDEEKPQIVNVHQDESSQAWEKSVANNISVHKTVHVITKPGNHMLKFHMVSPGLVLQKIVIDAGGLKSSYLGPESSYRKL